MTHTGGATRSLRLQVCSAPNRRLRLFAVPRRGTMATTRGAHLLASPARRSRVGRGPGRAADRAHARSTAAAASTLRKPAVVSRRLAARAHGADEAIWWVFRGINTDVKHPGGFIAVCGAGLPDTAAKKYAERRDDSRVNSMPCRRARGVTGVALACTASIYHLSLVIRPFARAGVAGVAGYAAHAAQLCGWRLGGAREAEEAPINKHVDWRRGGGARGARGARAGRGGAVGEGWGLMCGTLRAGPRRADAPDWVGVGRRRRGSLRAGSWRAS